MNKTDFSYPRDEYPDIVRAFYAGIDGADAAGPVQVSQAGHWHCRSQVSRGAVLEKAGHALLHIAKGRLYGSPGSIKFFETLAYPKNPCVPGFVFLMNCNQTEARGTSIVLYTDIFFPTGTPNPAARQRFATALEGVYDRHDRDFETRYKTEPGRILAGIAAECGIMDFFPGTDDDPFLDDLLPAALAAYREILDLTADNEPTDDDVAAMYRHRARVVEWLTVEDIGIEFAKASGVPLSVIESYGYPPIVRY